MFRNRIVVGAAIAALAVVGCKKDEKKGATDTPPTAGKTTAGTTMPPAAEWTPAKTVEKFGACLAAFNAHDADKLSACYAEKAEWSQLDSMPPMTAAGRSELKANVSQYFAAFPDIKATTQLLLAGNDRAAVIFLEEGTNSGEMMGMPATNKKISSFSGGVVWYKDGLVAKDWMISDQGTAAHQLGMHANPMHPDAETAWATPITVEVAAADKSKIDANIAIMKAAEEAMGKKDAKALLAMTADNVEFRYVPDKTANTGKAAYEKGLTEWLAMMETMKRETLDQWGAGDWVVSLSKATMKLAVDMPGTKNTKGKEATTHQLEFAHFTDGKLDKMWVFENSYSWAVQVGLAPDPAAMDHDGHAVEPANE